MSENQEPCEPLKWDQEFLLLLARMDGEIHREKRANRKETMIRYQTVIAAGGYLGLRGKEFLHLSWDDIIGKTETKLFQFKTKSKRKVYFAPSFIKIVERNFNMIDPENMHHVILHKKDSPTVPITTNQFNQYFKRRMDAAEIQTVQPSSHTLRKTFVLHLWEELGSNEMATALTAKAMNYSSREQVLDYIGVNAKAIKGAVVKFK